jgi:hypothetical protein
VRTTLSILAAAVLLCLACGVASAQTGNGTTHADNTGGLFTDVPKDHWAYEDLVYLADRGIVTGLPGGTFNGTDPLTRYDAAVLVARAVKYLEKGTTTTSGGVAQKDFDALTARVAALEKGGTGTAGGALLDTRLTQTEKDVATLRTQVQTLSSSDTTQLASRVNATFIMSLTALLLGIIAVALATLGL